ncbi:hypothetical protein PVK06_039722 [Gossypium arboreum]|uniref:Aminotransferase-like plant mobile domain-containing protein n=1 Tax=Gossypium arboreum TaxID=29729 RepID=A0ABR0N476_GOSAR|nr:hypothetical protein PVK06_039722 [Gossypium arboreum]
MARQLILLDDKHISVSQMQMPVDQVLQCFIHNLPSLLSPLIENYLREAGGTICRVTDQQSEAHFQWTPYEDSTIQAVILNEFLQNLNIWHVRVPLVSYTIVEIHQMDRLLQQFRWQQPIPVTSKMLDDEHKIDLRRPNTHWPLFH